MTVRFSLWIVLRMDVVYCSKTNAFVGMLQGIWLAALLVGYLFQRVTCQFGVPGDCVRAVRAIAVVELYLSSFLYEMDFIFEFTAVPGVVELHVQQQRNTTRFNVFHTQCHSDDHSILRQMYSHANILVDNILGVL